MAVITTFRHPAPAGVPRPARDAVVAVLPLALGNAPFALVIGTVVGEHGGLTALAGWSGSWLIYGGSAHLAVMRLLRTSGAFVAVLTGVLVNARVLVYSATLSRRWTDQPRWFRFVAAALIIDPTWAVTTDRAPTDQRSERRYFIAAGLTMGSVWSTSMAVGTLFGGHLHLAVLDVVGPLCLAAIVTPRLVRSELRAVAVVAGLVAAATRTWPAGTGLLAAIVAGWFAGRFTERRAGS